MKFKHWSQQLKVKQRPNQLTSDWNICPSPLKIKRDFKTFSLLRNACKIKKKNPQQHQNISVQHLQPSSNFEQSVPECGLTSLTSTPCELLHIPHPWHHVLEISSNVGSNLAKRKSFYSLWAALFKKPSAVFLGGCCWLCNQWWQRTGIQGAWMLANTPVKQLLSAFVLAGPSQQFHCSSTCARCCWAASLQLWTPGSPAAADGP